MARLDDTPTLFPDAPSDRYYYRQAVGDDGGPLQPHHLYRYELILRWESGPMLEWIMLNPSTADQHANDPTIRRCIGYAKRWGYAGIVVRNLYAYRSPSPSSLALAADPIGPRNAAYLANNIADITIAAWSAHGLASAWWEGTHPPLRRARWYVLGLSSNGAPRHPLYMPSSATPIRWEP